MFSIQNQLNNSLNSYQLKAFIKLKQIIVLFEGLYFNSIKSNWILQ